MDRSRRSRCSGRQNPQTVLIFVDTSTILAASGSAKGLSRLLFDCASKMGWKLVTAEYCVAEVVKNFSKIQGAAQVWNERIKLQLDLVPSEIVLDRPIIFSKTKDRPVIFSALGAKADYLVTSDTTDFAHVLGTAVYGVRVRTPRTFLTEMGIIA
jgi:predicted nucleic acid-binding protein